MAPLVLISAALGGAAMYFFDPERGRRRRALVRDQVVRASRKMSEVADAGARDLANRGAAAPRQLMGLLHRGPVSDDVLAERVRAKMGRYVAHPGAVDVGATQGRVTLCGAILAHEHGDFLRAVHTVRGVKEVIDELVVHKTADGVSALQGGQRRPGERMEFLQDNWSAGTRLATGASGALLALYGLGTKGLGRPLAIAAATALLARTVANKPLRQVAGRGGRQGIDLQKTIHIDAPDDEVFAFLANPENFPRFMRNVRKVERRGNGQSHWEVAGPAGTVVRWDSITTREVPNEHIAWRSMPGSMVEHAGTIDMEPSDGGTRVQIRMSYNPPAGALGHVVAKLFGADAKTELDEDLMRLKSALETGKAPHDAAQPA